MNEIGYTLRIAPQIENIFPREMGEGGGQEIVIYGKGFSTIRSENEVKLGGISCPITQVSASYIKCMVPPKPASGFGTGSLIGIERIVLDTADYETVHDNLLIIPVILRQHLLTTYHRSPSQEEHTEVLKGYFVPPETGEYRFRSASYYPSDIYFGDSKTQILDDQWALVHPRDYYTYAGKMTDFQSLTGGEKYYLEIIRYMGCSWCGAFNKLSVGVEKKHTTPHKLNVRQVQQVKIEGNPKYETYYFSVSNPSLDMNEYYYWKVYVNNANTGIAQSGTTSKKIYNRCSPGEFKTAINQAFRYIWTDIKLHIKDKSGDDMTITTNQMKTDENVGELIYEVRIRDTTKNTYPRINRDKPAKPIPGSGLSATLTYSFYPEFSPRLSGTFGVILNHPVEGSMLLGPFQICDNSQDMQRFLESQHPLLKGKIEIMVEYALQCFDFTRVSFHFIGFDADLELMEFSTDETVMNVSGGNDTEYMEEIIITQGFSHNLLWETIPPEYLEVGEIEGVVEVKTRGLASACPTLTDCTFSYTTDTPQISAFTYTPETTTLVLTGVRFDTKPIVNIQLGGVSCGGTTPPTVSSTEVSCLLDDTPVGGKYRPRVLDEDGEWVVLVDATLHIPFTIASVDPNVELNPNGGEEVTVTGEHFPSTLQQGEDLGIGVWFLGGENNIEVEVVSCASTEIKIITPRMPTSPVLKVIIHDLEVSFSSLTLSANPIPTLQAISPNTGSPVFHSDLTISISGDISNKALTDFRVYLVSNSIREELGVKEISNDASESGSVVARFVGGEQGEYGVEMWVNGIGVLGDSGTPPVFSIHSSISSVSPAWGSMAGGTEVTVTGSGFSEQVGDMYIYFGESECVIRESTTTQIVCTTHSALPPGTPALPSSDMPTIGVATLRLNAIGRCSNICYTFSRDKTPVVNSMEVGIVGGDRRLVITGSNLDISSPTVYIDGYIQSVHSTSGTEIVVEITRIKKLGVGEVDIKYTEGKAFFAQHPASPLHSNYVPIPTIFDEVVGGTTSQYSTRVILSGFGFADNAKDILKVIVGETDLCRYIRTLSITQLECQTYHTLYDAPLLVSMLTRWPYEEYPIICTQSSRCLIQSNAYYLDIYDSFVYTETLADVTLTATFHPNITICDSVYMEFGVFGVQEGVSEHTCSPPSECVWNIGVFSMGEYESELVCVVDGVKQILKRRTAEITQLAYTYTPSLPIHSSFGGGGSIGIAAKDIGLKVERGGVDIKICGVLALSEFVSDDQVRVIIPRITTNYTITNYMDHNYGELEGAYFSEVGNTTEPSLAFDDDLLSAYISDTPGCFVGIQLPSERVLKSGSIYITDLPSWNTIICHKDFYVEHRQAVYLESSSDGVTYNVVSEIPFILTHQGWNPFSLPESEVKAKYFRVKFEHMCNIGEVQLIGEMVVESSTSTSECEMEINYIEGGSERVSSAVFYKSTLTTEITGVSLPILIVEIGNELALTGVNLPTIISEIEYISLSGVGCVPVEGSLSSTSTRCRITELTGLSQGETANIAYYVKGKGLSVVREGAEVLVAHRWSATATWGGLLPQQGDSVYIPQSQSVLYDLDASPVFEALIVAGSLIFQNDDVDTGRQVILHTKRVLVRGGLLQVGTREAPYIYNTLTIKLHGNAQDKQLPIFGTKVIGLYDSTLRMFGREVTPTWTTLKANSLQRSEILTLNGPLTNWVVGDQIIVAPSKAWYQTEQRTIKSIVGADTDTVKITLDIPLKFEHIIEERTATASKTLSFPVEVGHLTRNIRLVGDESSSAEQFGGVLKIYGQSTAQVEYVELVHMGQLYQFGQYAISFDHVDDPSSYVKHTSIHASYNKGLCLINSYNINIDDNIAADMDGDGFGVDNVVYNYEVNNIFNHNLAIGIRDSWGFLEQGMVMGDGFSIHAPTNDYTQNVATGTAGNGFQYRTPCYYENHLWPWKKFEDNSAHNTKGAGIVALFFYPREKPLTGPPEQMCDMAYLHDIRYRQGTRGAIKNFVAFDNAVNIGFLDVGPIDFDNVVMARGRYSGFKTSATDHLETLMWDGIYLISDDGNKGPGIGMGDWSDGVFNNVTFSHYNTHSAMVPGYGFIPNFEETSWLSLSNVHYYNTTDKLHWEEYQMWTDIDGSLAGGNAGDTILRWQPHLHKSPQCELLDISFGFGDETLRCSQEVKFRVLYVTHIEPPELLYYNLSLIRLESDSLSEEELELFLLEDTKYGNYSYRHMWAPWEYFTEHFKMCVIEEETYWMKWRHDMDAHKFRMWPWHRWTESDGSVTFNYKYKDGKEYLNVSQVEQNQTCDREITQVDESTLETQFSKAGDYIHDPVKKVLTFSLSKKPQVVDWIYVDSEKEIPSVGELADLEDFFRNYSVTSNWPNSEVPRAGASITIEEKWQMYMDTDSQALDRVIVNGRLIFPNDIGAEVTLKARKIEIVKGSIIIGSESDPYKGKMATIHIDSQGSDILSTTNYGCLNTHGNLSIHGGVGRVQRISQLYEEIVPGGESLRVDQNLGDWRTGDEILIAASGFGGESERRNIAGYSTTGELRISAPVEYGHLAGTAVHNIGGYNVNIRGNSEGKRGGQLRVEDMLGEGFAHVPRVYVKEVLFTYMGMYHNERMAIKIYDYNTNNLDRKVVFMRNAFVDLYGGVMETLDSNLVEFRENVIYRPYMLGLLIERANEVSVTGNTMMSVEDELWKEYFLCKGLTFQGGYFICPFSSHRACKNITFSHNKLLGSETAGIATQGLTCENATERSSQVFYNNTVASSTWVGWFLEANQRDTFDCMLLKDFTMLHNLNYSLFVENRTYSLTLQNAVFDTVFESVGFGDGIINTTYNGTFKNITYIGNHENGTILNTKKRPELERTTSYEFDNLAVEYKYTDPANHFNLCDNTAIFYEAIIKNYKKLEVSKKHAALWVSERLVTYSHEFLYPWILFQGIKIENVDPDYFMLWESEFQHLIAFENAEFIGEFALNNSGQLSPNFQIINNTPSVGEQIKGCHLQSKWNAYYCVNPDLGVLCMDTHLRMAKTVHFVRGEFHSSDYSRQQLVGDDEIRRVSWLVNLVETSPGVNKYSVSFDSSLPPKITYFLLGQSVEKGIEMSIEYQKPLSIHLLVNETRTERKFFSSLESATTPAPLGSCGENIWEVKWNVLRLYVSGESWCRVRAETVNAIMVTLRLEVSVHDFFTGGGQLTFIDRVSAVLGIPTYRVRIAGVSEGSTVLSAFIDAADGSGDAESRADLHNLALLLDLSIANGELKLGYKILQYSVATAFVDDPVPDDDLEKSGGEGGDDSKFLIIGLCCGAVILFIIIVIIVILVRRHRKKRKIITLVESEINSDLEKKVPTPQTADVGKSFNAFIAPYVNRPSDMEKIMVMRGSVESPPGSIQHTEEMEEGMQHEEEEEHAIKKSIYYI